MRNAFLGKVIGSNPWSRDLGSIPTLVVYVIASLDKALYDDYICLVVSNKHKIKKSKKQPENSEIVRS